MESIKFVLLSAMPNWIIGVSHTREQGYQCWIINGDLAVLNDGNRYTTSHAALAAGRSFIESH
ncbi:hypothetical protein PN498_02525 [Oscillatoria sp. CS-180]|uniref:hypothetical protein n=1 Tax=Oscillatoria sp. CS-180 TaxID=3021720 RepID=UPI00232B6495|nr:hypothetical protein [Oscillatoria sp. CS-180]MDB9524850.1 hypothetical protein [Oscillatoria sp. CS-180]